MSHPPVRLGVDIGGTFADVVLEQGERLVSAKVLTTYAAPEDAILQGLAEVCAEAGVGPGEVTQIIHGTTLATTALIERRGAKTALLTTKGFRDVIEMRTESRFEQYDLNLRMPDPLLPRNRRYVVTERLRADGKVLIPLERAEVEALAEELGEAGYEAVAVGLLHSYVDDAHERMVAEVLAERLPGVLVSLSSQVSPQMREYERFNTTIANAFIQPLMKSYLDRLRARLAEAGAECPVFLMHSGGGIMSIESAAAFPVRLVESGPAGGAIFAADIATRHGLSKVLSFDMGGTTAKICMIRDGAPKTARVFEVARSYRFKKGSGMPISLPVIDMVEIGAGGGSLAHVDAMRQIRVGPESAGSEPGPACYGRGGARPAVTDADLMLGRLDPAEFAGGTIALDGAASEAALTAEVGGALGMDALEAAWGVAEVVDENMANAARVHAVENGEDLSEYTMIDFGGAAREQAKSMGSLSRGGMLAMLAIFGLLAVPFRSYAQPIIVMSAIPFGFIGALIGHVIMGFEMSMISVMGLIALAGAERDTILELIREGTVPPPLAGILMSDADRLIEATRGRGRIGYGRASRQSVGYGPLFRFGVFLNNRLKFTRPLARLTANRFELLLSQRLILRDLHGFINGRIRRIHGRRVADLLHEMLERRVETVTTALEGLRLQYPGYAEELERRFIRRTALRLEQREYDIMRGDGLIGAELHTVLVQEIARRRQIAEKRPPLDVALQKTELIRQIPLFEDLETGPLRRLTRALQTRYVNAGDVIMRKDVALKNVFFVASGAVELESAGQTLRLGRGEMFGQIALLTARRRRAVVRAITPTILLVLDEARFRRLLTRSALLREAEHESARERGISEDLLEMPDPTATTPAQPRVEASDQGKV